MRLLLCTNHYGCMAGGAVAMAATTRRLLESAGHDVVPFAIREEKAYPSEWDDYWPTAEDLRNQILAVGDELETPYSFVARRKLDRLIEAARPDVAHLHNVSGKLTFSVVDALRARGVPIVLTLHEYKAICPNGWLATHDGVCHRCVGRTTLHAVRHRCMDGSLPKSVLAAAEATINRRRRQFDKIDLMLAPSQFLKDQVVQGGLDARRIRIVRNPAERVAQPDRRLAEVPRFVFFGRLVENKGIDVLLSASKLLEGKAEVAVFGSGPLERHVRDRVDRERLPVTFRGYADRHTIGSELGRCTASILPSLWYENAPMAIIEAAGCGVATIASAIGAIPETIEEGKTGILVRPGDPDALAEAMRALADDRTRALEMGRYAWERVGEQHDPRAHLEEILEAYEWARSARRNIPANGVAT